MCNAKACIKQLLNIMIKGVNKALATSLSTQQVQVTPGVFHAAYWA